MKKVIKLTESDLYRIVKKVLQEQIVVDGRQNFQAFEKSMMGVNPKPRKFDYKDNDTVVTSLNWGSSATKDTVASYSVAIDSREPKMVIAPTAKDTATNSKISRYNTQLLANINKFFKDKGYSIKPSRLSTEVTIDFSKGGEVKNDLNELFKLYQLPPTEKKQPFEWKQAPTAEEVQSGTKLLRYGMMGDFVGVVQEKLQSEGYNVGPIDSKFGGKTLKAVKEFQSNVGLKDDGLVGKNTYFAMFRETQTPIANLKTKGIKDVNSTKTTTTNQEQPFTSGMTTIDQDGNRTVVTRTTSNPQTQPTQTQAAPPAQSTPPQTSNIETQEW